MKKTLLASSLALSLVLTADAQERPAPTRPATPREAPKAKPEDAGQKDQRDAARDEAAQKEAARREAELARLRAAFGEEYFAKKAAAGEELEAARTRTGGDAAAFASARTEIARRYRGELAALRRSYAEKAKAAGVAFALPEDDAELERAATAAAPATALRVEFTARVAELARAASAEVAAARKANEGNPAGLAEKRTEIARRYRGQVVALQQAFAERAGAQGVSVDTSDVSKVMNAVQADETAEGRRRPNPVSDKEGRPKDAAGRRERDGATPPDDATAPPAATPPKPVPQPIDAETLRTAFTKQIESLRTALKADLTTADSTLKGDALTAKRAEITARYRGQVATYRANVAARAQAAGVTLNLPTDAELVPELAGEGPPPDGQTPPKDGASPPKGQDGTTPPKGEPAVGPGGKRGKAPRFGGGGGG